MIFTCVYLFHYIAISMGDNQPMISVPVRTSTVTIRIGIVIIAIRFLMMRQLPGGQHRDVHQVL